MKRAIFIVLPILTVLAGLACLVLPGSVTTPEEKRLAALWDGSEAVYLAEVTEIEKPPPSRIERAIYVKYTVVATHRGPATPALQIDFEVPSPGEIALPADPFTLGARHLLFLRRVSPGPFLAFSRDTQDRVVPATPERIKIVEKLAQPK